MKSWRLKSVALTWLHGGHHLAPQYTNTGLFSLRALAKAASTSASLAAWRQAMPASACSGAALAVGAGAAAVVPVAGDAALGAGLSQATSASAAASVARTGTAPVGRTLRIGFIASPMRPPSWRNQSTG